MTTRIEKLCPEITTLAASIGQTVCYHGGDYFLVPCQRSLWNTRDFGRLTRDGAEMARVALARMVERVKPDQERPIAERVQAVAEMLRAAKWRPQHFAEVTTAAQDRGTLSRWLGKWTVSIQIVGGPDVTANDYDEDRGATIDAAVRMALETADNCPGYEPEED